MLGWQGAGKILADNLGACLQHSRTEESEESEETRRSRSRSAVPIYFPEVILLLTC